MWYCLCLLGFSLGVYSCGRARPWSLCENEGENNVRSSVRSFVHPSVRRACVCVCMRMTCVHRQSLTFRDLRTEHRPYCTPYISLSLPSPILSPLSHLPPPSLSSSLSSPALYIDAFCARARDARHTCIRWCRCERASAPSVAAINTNWCICACSFHTRPFAHSANPRPATVFHDIFYFTKNYRELYWLFLGKTLFSYANQKRARSEIDLT